MKEILLVQALLNPNAVEVVRISVQPDYPPYLMMINSHPAGICGDVAADKLKASSLKFEYRQVPFARALRELENGTSDAVLMVFRTKMREPFILYPEMHLCTEEQAVFSLNDTANVNNITLLENMHVGFIRGFSYGNTIDSNKYIIRHEVHDQKSLVKMLLSKRVSYIIGGSLGIRHTLNELGSLSLVRKNTLKIHGDFKLYLGISEKSIFKEKLTTIFNNK